MAGKGQAPKRKTAAKGTERAGKKAPAESATPEPVSEQSVAEPDTAEASAAASDVVAPSLAPDEPPRPDLHPLARMSEDAPAPEAGDQPTTGAIEHVTTLATTSYSSGYDAGLGWVETARDTIREQPIKSLLIATGVGFLYGLARR